MTREELIAARVCWATDPDPVCQRDRNDYFEWQYVPEGLREWYRHRAFRKAQAEPEPGEAT